jgi:DNA-directed RNA polymerase subunit alpha
MIPNTNLKKIMTKTQTTDFFIACKESRIENNTSFYGCFYLGPFDDSLSQTLANDLRRTLLSELTGLAITSIEIEGVLHKFSSLPGMKESVLDLICNLQNIVLKKQEISSTNITLRPTKKTYTGFLNISGPHVIKAMDLKLPAGLLCVDPNQYIATLAEDGFLNMKFNINEGKNFIKQKSHNLDVSVLKKRNILIQNFKDALHRGSASSEDLPGLTSTNTFNSTLLTSTAYGKLKKVAHPGLLKSKDKQDKKKATFKEQGHVGSPSGNYTSFAGVGSFAVQRPNYKVDGVSQRITSAFNNAVSNPIPLDAVFMPVTKINCIIEENNIYSDFSTDPTNPVSNNMYLPGSKAHVWPLDDEGYKQSHRPKNNIFLSNSLGSLTTIHKKQQQPEQFQTSLALSKPKINTISPYSDFQSFLNTIDYNSIYQTCAFFSQKTNNSHSLQNKIKLIPWQSNSLYFDISNISNNNAQKDFVKTKHASHRQFNKINLNPSSFTKIKTFLACKNSAYSKELIFNNTQSKVSKLPEVNFGALLNVPFFKSFSTRRPVSAEQIKSIYPMGQLEANTFKQENKTQTVKSVLNKQATRLPSYSSAPNNRLFKINSVNGLNQHNIPIEYAKNLKLKPLRKKTQLIVEVWTNGSIHPRQALYQSFIFLSNNFLKLQTVKMLGSMFKSELAYENLKYSINNNYNYYKGNNVKLNNNIPKQKTKSITSAEQMNSANLQYKTRKMQSIKASSLNDMTFYLQASLKAPVGILKISLRAYTALKKAGIFTLNDLIVCSKKDLLKIKNLGSKSLFEIENSLSVLGLTLKNAD